MVMNNALNSLAYDDSNLNEMAWLHILITMFALMVLFIIRYERIYLRANNVVRKTMYVELTQLKSQPYRTRAPPAEANRQLSHGQYPAQSTK